MENYKNKSKAQLIDIIENRLKESEYLLKESQKVARLGSYVFDIASGMWSSSEVLDSIFGITDELKKDVKGWLQIIHPEHQTEMQHYLIQHVLTEHKVFNKEYRIIKYNSKEERWVHGLGELTFDTNGNPVKMIGTIQDITGRKKIEVEMGRVMRALKVRSETNKAIIHSTDETTLLKEICQLLIKVGEYRLAWIGYAEKDKQKTVRPVVQAGYEAGYLESLNITWADTKHGQGPTGKAIRSGEPALAKDIHNDPQFAPWHDEAVKRGYASSIALPLMINGQIIGALNIYAHQADAFDNEEVDLLKKLSEDLSYGVNVLRTRLEREKVQDELNKQMLRNEKILHTTMDGYILTDHAGILIDVNPAYCEMVGYSREELLAMDIRELEILLSPEETDRRIKQIIEKGWDHLETKHKCKNGKIIDLEVSIVIMHSEASPLVAAFLRDITARKRAEYQITYQANLLQNVSDAIVSSDLNFHIMSWNKAAENIYGWKLHEILGKSFNEIVKPEYIDAERDQVIKEFQEKGFWKGEVIQYKKNGQKIHILSAVSSVTNEQGKPIGAVAVNHDITEHKKAEALILKERNQSQQYLDIAGVMLAVLNENGNILLINKKGCQILGYDENEILHKNWFDLCISEDIREEIKGVFKKLIHGEVSPVEYYENEIITKNKELRTIAFHNSIIRNEENHITGVLFSGEDITEHKRAEDTLKTERDFINVALNTQPDTFFVFEIATGKAIRWNHAFNKVSGYSDEEIRLMKAPESYYSESDLKKAESSMEEILKKGQSTIEMSLITKDGKTIPLEYTGGVITNPEGNPTYLIAIGRDITERKKAEKALKESEQRFKFTLKDSKITVFNQNPDLRYTWIYNPNPGFSTDFIIGKTDEELFPEGEAKILMEIKQEALKTGNKQNAVVPSIVDGKTSYHDIMIEPMYDETGLIIGISGTSTDITDLENTKLKAEENDKLKSAFLANMSHEIRTPMNGIIGFSQLLNNPKLTEEKRKKYVQIIQDSSNQLLNIINDIVDISKIEAGQASINIQRVSINDKLSEIFTFHEPIAQKKGIELILKKGLKDQDSIILTDGTKFQQIINNLMSNAIKFTSQGHVTFGYYLKGDHLEFYVKDTGIGIMAEHQEKIFDRFYQVEIGSTRQHEGTGLGLSITKAFIKLLGGKLWLTSAPSSGSTFYFTIPYQAVNESYNHLRYDNNQTSLSGKTILIVEDNESNYLFLKELLLQTNAKIIHAKNGKEAVDYCKKLPDIHIVLMDIKMPIMDGYEAIKIIKGFNPDLPIIAQTAFAMSDDEKKAIEAGSDDYISKPVKGSLLIKKIKQYIGQNGE